MTVHFICRGNAFRSLIAEAYLKSLAIPDLAVLSSGSVATTHKQMNRNNHRLTLLLLQQHGLGPFVKPTYADQLTAERLKNTDVAICLNNIVVDECKNIPVILPPRTLVWDVTDIGEKDRIATSDDQRMAISETVFAEITDLVDAFAEAEGWTL